MKKFEVGKVYYMKSTFDCECVWEYTVISRTEKTVRLKDNETGNEISCRIAKALAGELGEKVYPIGKYSMAPVLRAERIR